MCWGVHCSSSRWDIGSRVSLCVRWHTVMSSPQEAQGGASAFSAWLSQVSGAISGAFLGPAKPGPTAAEEPPADRAQDGADTVQLEDGLQSGRSSRAGVASLDVSAMDPQEKLEAIRARLAQLGLTDEQITERLSTIPEENEDLESQLFDLEEGGMSTLTPHCSDQDTARQCSSGALIHDLYLCSIVYSRKGVPASRSQSISSSVLIKLRNNEQYF